MKYSYGVVHAHIQCEDCGKEFTSHKNAQAIAAQHARRYRHNVDGEIGIRVGYFGKEDGDKNEK